ncbi:unnamed protein product, partial [Mesorhabditis spiculigera]
MVLGKDEKRNERLGAGPNWIRRGAPHPINPGALTRAKMHGMLLCLLGVVAVAAAAPIGAHQTTDVEEAGVPIHIENRSNEPVVVSSDGKGATVKIGETEASTGTFPTPWGPVTLITDGKATLNVNFTPKHMNIVVGLNPDEWTGDME